MKTKSGTLKKIICKILEKNGDRFEGRAEGFRQDFRFLNSATLNVEDRERDTETLVGLERDHCRFTIRVRGVALPFA